MAQRSPSTPPKERLVPLLVTGGILGVALAALIVYGPDKLFHPGNGTQAPLETKVRQAAHGKVAVYFCKQQGDKTVVSPVYRDTDIQDSDKRLTYALEVLTAGPNTDEIKTGYYSELPKDMKVLGVSKTEDGQSLVNLSSSFRQGEGAHTLVQRIAQVRQTALANNGGRPVNIQVEGELLKDLPGEGLEVPQPMSNHP